MDIIRWDFVALPGAWMWGDCDARVGLALRDELSCCRKRRYDGGPPSAERGRVRWFPTIGAFFLDFGFERGDYLFVNTVSEFSVVSRKQKQTSRALTIAALMEATAFPWGAPAAFFAANARWNLIDAISADPCSGSMSAGAVKTFSQLMSLSFAASRNCNKSNDYLICFAKATAWMMSSFDESPDPVAEAIAMVITPDAESRADSWS